MLSPTAWMASTTGPGPSGGSAVYTDENLTVRVVSWKPESSTAVHNHNSWVLIGGVKGNERNTNYRRLDDGSRPWHAQLEEVETVDIRPGVCNSLLPPHDIHAVTIPEGEALALHVYGTDLGREWRFQFNLETGGSLALWTGRQGLGGLGHRRQRSLHLVHDSFVLGLDRWAQEDGRL